MSVAQAQGVARIVVDVPDRSRRPRIAQRARRAKDALAFWQSNRITRRPMCIGCRCSLADPNVQAGAFLFATLPNSPGIASVSALCVDCWRDLPMDQIGRAACSAATASRWTADHA